MYAPPAAARNRCRGSTLQCFFGSALSRRAGGSSSTATPFSVRRMGDAGGVGVDTGLSLPLCTKMSQSSWHRGTALVTPTGAKPTHKVWRACKRRKIHFPVFDLSHPLFVFFSCAFLQRPLVLIGLFSITAGNLPLAHVGELCLWQLRCLGSPRDRFQFHAVGLTIFQSL